MSVGKIPSAACAKPHEINSVYGIPTKGKSPEKCKPCEFTTNTGITFTVTLVNPQVVRTECPICLENVITANNICSKTRYHVVCTPCVSKLIDDKASSRCPECNIDNSQASPLHMQKMQSDTRQELNNAKIKCKTCEYEGEFYSIYNHTHGSKPSPTPFYNHTVTHEAVVEELNQLAEHLTSQLFCVHGGSEREIQGFFFDLGLSTEEIFIFSDRASKQAASEGDPFVNAARFKYLLIQSFVKREKINNPITKDDISNAISYLSLTVKNLTWINSN